MNTNRNGIGSLLIGLIVLLLVWYFAFMPGATSVASSIWNMFVGGVIVGGLTLLGLLLVVLGILILAI